MVDTCRIPDDIYLHGINVELGRQYVCWTDVLVYSRTGQDNRPFSVHKQMNACYYYIKGKQAFLFPSNLTLANVTARHT